jgi:hypothetical protein
MFWFVLVCCAAWVALWLTHAYFMPNWTKIVGIILFLSAFAMSLFNKGDGNNDIRPSLYVAIIAASLLGIATIFFAMSNANTIGWHP